MATTTLQASIDAIVSGAGLTIGMHQITGGEITRDTAKSRDPGAKFPRAVPAPGDIGNVTTIVDYDRLRHRPMLPVLRAAATGETEFSISRIDRDGAGNASGTTTYTGIIVRLKEPEGNTMGGADKATLEIEFAVSGVSG